MLRRINFLLFLVARNQSLPDWTRQPSTVFSCERPRSGAVLLLPLPVGFWVASGGAVAGAFGLVPGRVPIVSFEPAPVAPPAAPPVAPPAPPCAHTATLNTNITAINKENFFIGHSPGSLEFREWDAGCRAGDCLKTVVSGQ